MSARTSADPPVPDDVAAALRGSAAAQAAWQTMPPSHHGEFLDWIAQAKRPETRVRRIAQMVARLEAGD
jgi:uncharacterized protein YdeI (YjbR/CyaY-like superfamily)